MAYREVACVQGTPEWRAARAGRLTGSVAKFMLAKARTKTDESAGRRNLRFHLAIEQVTGKPHSTHFLSKDMEIGTEQEPNAILAYEQATGEMVDRVGFLQHTELMAGLSPDGLIVEDGAIVGVVEAKVRRPANHWEIVIAESFPTEYHAQCLHALWLTGAAWVDLASFCPDFPGSRRLAIRRLERGACDVDAYESAVRSFLDEVAQQTREVAHA